MRRMGIRMISLGRAVRYSRESENRNGASTAETRQRETAARRGRKTHVNKIPHAETNTAHVPPLNIISNEHTHQDGIGNGQAGLLTEAPERPSATP